MVTFSSVTEKLALSVNVVPLPPPFSTLAAEEPDPVPLPSIVRLASLPPLTEKFALYVNVHTELVEHAVPFVCSSSIITFPLPVLAAVIALGRLQGLNSVQEDPEPLGEAYSGTW
jgi:hypothetical protein